MSEHKLLELGVRITRCQSWRWHPGMLAINPLGGFSRIFYAGDEEKAKELGCFPDLRDSATIGCLITLVREAWMNRVVIMIGNDWWDIEADSDNENYHFYSNHELSSSFAESLILALEAAP